MSWTKNPFTDQLDAVGDVKIPQSSTDPASPAEGDVWVLRTVGAGGGVIKGFLGLGFPCLSVGSGVLYQLSYRTTDGSTKRATLS